MTTEERSAQAALTEALREPSAPENLIRRTVLRCQAVSRGREAEEELTKPDGRSKEETARLLAYGLLGRLAQDVPLPERTTPENAVEKILSDKRFQAAAQNCNPARALQSGALLRQLTAEPKQSVPTPPERAVEKKSPSR